VGQDRDRSRIQDRELRPQGSLFRDPEPAHSERQDHPRQERATQSRKPKTGISTIHWVFQNSPPAERR